MLHEHVAVKRLAVRQRDAVRVLGPGWRERPDRQARALQHRRPDRDGQRFAISYTKVHNRLLRPLLSADRPPASLEVPRALRSLELAVEDYIRESADSSLQLGSTVNALATKGR